MKTQEILSHVDHTLLKQPGRIFKPFVRKQSNTKQHPYVFHPVISNEFMIPIRTKSTSAPL